MNYKPFKVDILRSIDSTKEAWITSKPTIKYNSEEELQETVNKMASQDLPLAAFVSYQLRVESSLLFRDLLFAIRPCIAWSSSFRINPIQDGNIFLEGDKSGYKEVENFIDSHMEGLYYKFDQGAPLDEIKLGLYLGTMTQYVITIDSRTLMCLIATLVDMDAEGFSYHILELCKVLGYSSYKELPKTSAVSLYNKLKLGDTINYSDYTPNKDYKVSNFTCDHELFATLDVIVNASTGGQFLRQHFSLMRTNLFDIVKNKGYKECLLLECSDRFRYISCGQVENFTQLVRRRICHVCNWDWSVEDRGVESWTDIIGPLVEKMTPQEFAKMLPCRCNYKKCTVSEETRLRLWKNKGIEGVTPDANPQCFPSGSLINTLTGLVKIEDIKVGDKVLSDKGEVSVLATYKSESDCKLVNSIFTDFWNEKVITHTKDHKFFNELSGNYEEIKLGNYYRDYTPFSQYDYPIIEVSKELKDLVNEYLLITSSKISELKELLVSKGIDYNIQKWKDDYGYDSDYRQNSVVIRTMLFDKLFSSKLIKEEVNNLVLKNSLKVICYNLDISYSQLLNIVSKFGINPFIKGELGINSPGHTLQIQGWYRVSRNNFLMKFMTRLTQIYKFGTYGHTNLIKYNNNYYYTRSKNEIIPLIYYLENNLLKRQEPCVNYSYDSPFDQNNAFGDFELITGEIIEVKDSNFSGSIDYGKRLLTDEEISFMSDSIKVNLSKFDFDHFMVIDLDNCDQYNLLQAKSQEETDPEIVYDFQTESGNHMINGILVHNCPILMGDPSYVQKRIDFYKSNSIIADKWKSLVENGLIKERETEWKQENER